MPRKINRDTLDPSGLALYDAIRATGKTQAQIAREAGVSQSMISMLINGQREGKKELRDKLFAYLGLTYSEVYGEQPQETQGQGKVAGRIHNSDIQMIFEWVMDQENPARLAANIRFMIEGRWPEFEKWQRRRKHGSNNNGGNGSISGVGP